ncbi:MAG: prepilin-type N-terminal cleavage/methylation domain-containing protein [Bacilli bacterium]|nr:prepilin-type N-terminal cleavage/methylation domain-containing protein [Bacilli bacterium]MBR6137423.1 prepilin-type N-terminal cleavage/methylation domain-containing protein [Bacilli bacterium]
MNKKGFTLIEILAAVTILGILSVLAIGWYTNYLEYSKKNSYKTMAKSISTAAEEYVMDNPGAATKTFGEEKEDGSIEYYIDPAYANPIYITDLIEKGYLNGAQDPDNKGTNCKGSVRIGLIDFDDKNALDEYIYEVDISCANRNGRYLYTFKNTPDGKNKSVEEANITIAKEELYLEGTSVSAPTFKLRIVTCSQALNGEYHFRKGMTVKEWVNSGYFDEALVDYIARWGASPAEKDYYRESVKEDVLDDIVSLITHDENYVIQENEFLDFNSPLC